MAARRLSLLVSILALVAVACGTGSVVVSGPSIQPADGAAGPLADGVVSEDQRADEIQIELPEDFTFDGSVFGEDSGSASAGEQADDDTPTDDAEAAGDTTDAAPTVLAFVQRAADDTAATETYRYEVFFEMYVSDGQTVLDVAPADPITTGAVAGARTWERTDMGAIFDAVFDAAGGGSAADLLGSDLAMEIITEGADQVYLRAPLFASMAELGALPGADDLAALGDGWGYIDLAAATGLTADEFGSLTGAQTGASAEDLLAMIAALGGVVTEVGAAEVRGVPTTQFRAEVGLAEVMVAQNVTVDDLAAFGSASLDSLSLPFDVFVDGDGWVRRMSVVIDTSLFESLIGDAPAGAEARISTTVDLYGFGTDIDITDPTTLGAVDVTDAFVALSGG